jgi:L-iditol 2-dehydrogenase
MKAIVWQAAQKVKIEEQPQPQINPDQVLVKLDAVGICGSDVKLYKTGVLGTLKPSKPFIMGHEGAGTIAEIGSNVVGTKVGDDIMVNPQATCGQCYYCNRQQPNLCSALDFLSVTRDGLFSEYGAIRVDQAIPLAAHIEKPLATTIEPLSIAVQSVRQTEVAPSDSVVILGGGAIGLMILMVLQNKGVEKVIVVDILPHALERAAQLGAYATVNNLESDVLQAIPELLGGRQPDSVFEIAGSPVTQAQAIDLVRPGGTAVMTGISSDDKVGLNVNRIVRSNIQIHGTVRTSGDSFAAAANLINTDQIDTHSLISQIFPFEKGPEALAYTADRQNEVTKCVLSFE